MNVENLNMVQRGALDTLKKAVSIQVEQTLIIMSQASRDVQGRLMGFDYPQGLAHCEEAIVSLFKRIEPPAHG